MIDVSQVQDQAVGQDVGQSDCIMRGVEELIEAEKAHTEKKGAMISDMTLKACEEPYVEVCGQYYL